MIYQSYNSKKEVDNMNNDVYLLVSNFSGLALSKYEINSKHEYIEYAYDDSTQAIEFSNRKHAEAVLLLLDNKQLFRIKARKRLSH